MAQDLNAVYLVGRLTKTVGEDERSFGYVGNGMAKAELSIAVNRSKKQGDQWVDEVSYFNIQFWGKPAENLKPYLVKGQQLVLSCHLKQDRWEKDGQKHSAISIIADNVQLVGGKKDEGFSANKTYPTAQAARQASAQAQAPQQQEFSPDEGFPEDIPF